MPPSPTGREGEIAAQPMPDADMFPDLLDQLGNHLDGFRGRLTANAPLADLTWFRVGGPAQLLVVPADEEDLALFMARLPEEIPVSILGLASNTLVRDGGVPGAVIRLAGRVFGEVKIEGTRITAGAALPDVKLARAAGEAGIAGFAFFRGIPGCVGGALRMNAGSYGGQTSDALCAVRGVDRSGNVRLLAADEMGLSYRHSDAPDDLVFTEAIFDGEVGDRSQILAAMNEITDKREATQPVKSRTGGSTFKNPPGRKAWQLIDAAGCRGLAVGGAHMSELHCNFMINGDGATAADLEALGEEVRRRVRESSGVELDWEIKRIGIG